MKDILISEIIQATGGSLVNGELNRIITGVTTDSSKAGPGDLFVALIGETHDGHDYIDIAIEQGASAVLISRKTDKLITPNQLGVAFIYVPDTLKGLQDFAAYYISLFSLRKIAVTGSTGKTTTKDMLHAIFSEKYKTLKTIGNFNNHIGLPLTIFQIEEQHEAGIFEMGMRGLGEIDLLARILRPDVGVITNIGLSHVETLGTKENILRAKMEIVNYFTGKGLLVVNGDDDFLRDLAHNELDYNVITVGCTSGCDARIWAIKDFGEDGIRFDLEVQNKIESIGIKTPGRHNAYNASLAIATGLVYGIDMKTAAKGLSSMKQADKRLCVQTAHGLKIIDDTYNASPDSMIAALDVLISINGGRKIAILADMLELGGYTENFHLEVGSYAAAQNIDMLIAVGHKAKGIYLGAIETMTQERARYFETKEELLDILESIIMPGDVILVKGSRGMAMDQIVKRLLKA